jgi:hypothetical protein
MSPESNPITLSEKVAEKGIGLLLLGFGREDERMIVGAVTSYPREKLGDGVFPLPA